VETLRSFQPGQLANAARLLSDLYRLGTVRQAQGLSLDQVAIVTLPTGGETIWVSTQLFRRLKYSPAFIQLAGPNPTPAADVDRVLSKGCAYVRLLRPGSLQGIEEEEHVML
jgi:hypothetical protein